METPRSRPLGLVIVVILAALFSTLGLLISGYFLWGPMLFDPSMGFVSGTALAVVALFLGWSVLMAIAVYGLWRWQTWGRNLAMIVYGIGAILGFISVPYFYVAGVWIIGVILFVLIGWMFIYVTRSKIKELFTVQSIAAEPTKSLTEP